MHRAISGTAVSILAVMMITACGSSGTGTATAAAGKKCVARILTVANFSGSGSQNGEAVLAGADLAIKRVNSAGGADGCQVVMDTQDDASDYTKDLPEMQEATSQHNYALVMNPDYGASATAQYVARQNLLEIANVGQPNYTEPSAPYPTIFDTGFLSSRATDVAAQYALSKNYRRIALIVDNTTYGASDIKAMQPLVKSLGGTITDIEQIDTSGVDFTAAIQRVKASRPQAVIIDIFGAAAAHLITEIHQLGLQVPIIGGQTTSATSFQGLVPASYLTGEIMVGPSSMVYPSDKTTQDFINSLQANGVSISNFLWGYTQTYNAILLFSWAANQTHSLDAVTLANKLHASGSVPIPGLVGSTTTGYTPTSGEWNPELGLAVMKAGYYNLGRLPLIKITSAPN
jgi:branched-chain amino acid transport system substrate-binding protein